MPRKKTGMGGCSAHDYEWGWKANSMGAKGASGLTLARDAQKISFAAVWAIGFVVLHQIADCHNLLSYVINTIF